MVLVRIKQLDCSQCKLSALQFVRDCIFSFSSRTLCHEFVSKLFTCLFLNRPFIGQTMIVTSPILGVVVDRFGPLALMSFLGFCGCFGVSMLLTAVTIPADNLLFVAFVFIGLMASASSIMTVKTGMVFADDNNNNNVYTNDIADHQDNDQSPADTQRGNKNQSRVISILNALFDAGSVTYLGLWGISEMGPSISAVFGMYLILAVICFGGVIGFWIALGDDALGEKTAQSDNPENGPRTEIVDCKKQIADATSNANSSTTVGRKDAITTNFPRKDSEYTDVPVEIGDAARTEASAAEVLDPKLPPSEEPKPEYVLVCDRTPRHQLLSLPFIMLVIFFAINLALNQFVLTTARDFLGYLGDDETSKQYLSIFTLLMPASILGLPFTDQVIARYGFHAGFQTICLLAAVHGVIQVSCDKLNGVQIFGFVVFSFYRCFLFSIVFSYIPTLLGPNVVGKGVGALHLAGGAFSFLNIPISNLVVKHLGGNFFVPNLFYTILVIPCSVAAWIIGRSIQREEVAKRNSLKRNGTG